jgi:hypothetical protein
MKRLFMLLSFALAGCMDITPIVLTVDGGDATPITFDAPVAEADAGLSECDRCVFGLDDAGPGCSAELAACDKMEACAKTVICARANGCLEGKDFKGILDCGIPCAKAAGVTDQTSPEAQAILELIACVQNTCAKPCRVP